MKPAPSISVAYYEKEEREKKEEEGLSLIKCCVAPSLELFFFTEKRRKKTQVLSHGTLMFLKEMSGDIRPPENPFIFCIKQKNGGFESF